MTTATNIDATAVNTVGWLSSGEATIVVPVYQRQYRWDIGGCEQLLADIRSVADSDDRDMHFIGSVLSSLSADRSELVLIDGQQRITTLLLLVAALQHTVRDTDPALAARLHSVLVGSNGQVRLRPHEAWAGVFESVVFDQRPADGSLRDSRFDDNYAFFRSQITASEAPHIWRGIEKLEHVAITLGAGANAQQIFASLNSTGEPLRDHELIHNYILMGLDHAAQREIEREVWAPIEQNTGDAIGPFWRHYMVMTTGREVAVSGEHGVYGEFRAQHPHLEPSTLGDVAAHWRDASAAYRVLLDPSLAPDPEVGRHLGYLATFGKAMYPLVMRGYLDWAAGSLSRDGLVALLEGVQSLLLRRAVAGLPLDRLVARLCRAREDGAAALTHAIARITPSDDRMRAALTFSEVPHASYVLRRLSGVDASAALVVDHILPLTPSPTWSGDGVRAWSEYSDDERNAHRALSKTLGNLTLLEEPLAAESFDASFPVKRRALGRSSVPLSADLAAAPGWGTAAIAARTHALAERFIEIWPRAATGLIDDDGLTPILDAVRRRGWPRGWDREFAYVEYRGEHWEVPDVKYLFNRIFKRLWADQRDAVLAFSAANNGPVYDTRAWNGQWDHLGEDHHLYMGWDSRYMLAAVQGVLETAGIAPEVFVKYSYIGNAM